MRISSRAIVIKENCLLVMYRNKFGRQFLSLLGGAVESGEEKDSAAIREVREESQIVIANPKLVIIENAGEVYGMQYIYLCDYVSGQPKLDPSSQEAKINAVGKNLYQPKWLPISELASSNMLPIQLRDLLVEFLNKGFPEKPLELTIRSDSQM